MKPKLNFIKFSLLATSLLASQAYALGFEADQQPLGYIGPIELSNTDLVNGAKAYRGWFENGGWQGDLIEYDVSSSGSLTTSVDLSGISPKPGLGTNWSAHVQFAAKSANLFYWDTGREIITNIDGTQQPFRWNSLTAAQQKLVDLNAYNNGDTSSDIVNFLRGQRVNEYPLGNLRQRYSILGDIIHSNPEYVGIPQGDSTDSSYVDFINANLNREPRVYVGANDGMLHAFDAKTGDEAWAYVPSMLIGKIARLAGRPYAHSYYVDGGISVTDAEFLGDWHSVLVGSLGSGAQGLYALDVTDPDLISETSTLGSDLKVLWEIDASDDDVGYIFDTTTVTQLNDGNWYAINGNGLGSVNGNAVLLLVNIETGVLTRIPTGISNSGASGLAAPALVDVDNDGDADIAWAGDSEGNMWRFDLSAATSSGWAVDYKLYAGVDTQPITMAPDVSNHPQTGHLVLYGTGQLYTAADITNDKTQALYGLWDTGTAPGTSNQLAQVLSADTDFTSQDGVYDEEVRTFTTTTALNWNVYNGWRVDLPAGERLLTQPQIRAGRLKATITNPNGFSNWLIETTFDEGGTADDTIYDLDRNGLLNTLDRVDNNLDNDLLDLEDIPMAWKRSSGNMSQVTIARVSQGFDTLFLNFLNPPLVDPPASGVVVGGLEGGHIDVDTDSSTYSNHGGELGLSTDAHVHEYDDKHGLTFIDYLDINADGGSNGDLKNIDSELGDPIAKPFTNTTQFIVLIANADFSPGAELKLGHKTYNVVEYQEMMHRQMAAWDGLGALLDDGDENGNNRVSLIHSLAQIAVIGPDGKPGDISNSFNSRSLINGGVHPTKTGCVKGMDNYNGRWRNGALTMHLVRRNHFLFPAGRAIDKVTVHVPTDLSEIVYMTDGTQVKLKNDLNGNGVIDPGAPDYEAYGGFLATTNEEFLYESTVFWHFSGACYGEFGWEEDVANATGSITQELYNQLLAEAGFATIDELAAKIAELEASGCTGTKEKKGGCKETYEELTDLYNLGLLVDANNGGGGGGGGGDPGTGLGNISGDPVVMTGGIDDSGLTSGPNFETGRRTWTDIQPQ